MGVILFASNVYANFEYEIVVNRDGKKFHVEKHKIGNQTFRSVNWEKTDALNYKSHSSVNASVRSAETGARSASTVPARVTASVPKTTVMSNLFKNAKAGGRLAGRLAGGALGWGVLAYELVNHFLIRDGWTYDKEEGNWTKPSEKGKFIIILTKTFSGWPDLSHGYVHDDVSLAKLCEGKDGCQKMLIVDAANVNEGAKAACATTDIRYGDKTYKADGTSSGFRCALLPKLGRNQTTYVNEWYAKPVRYAARDKLSQDDFNRIIIPHADAAPSEYVDKSRPTENAPVPGMKIDENVTVPNGTIAQTNPYTNPQTGQPEQTRWEFKTENNTTTVKEIRTPRPDLKPNSPEAPKSEKQPDTESKTDGEQNPENTPSDKPKTENPPQSGLCDMFPGILACDKMGELQEDEPFSIPHVTDETTFKPDFFLPDTGVCPAPQSVSIMGQQYSFTYEWLCRFAEMIRFLVIGIAGIIAAYIMFSGLRKG